MRWLIMLLLATAAALTARGELLREIKVGTAGRTVGVVMTPWYSGFISTSQAFLTGTVMDVSSNVETSPRQTWLSEACTVRVDHAFGQMARINDIATANLVAGYESSPYEPVDSKWGRLRHLQKGSRVLVLLHEYEGDPCFGFEALIELAPEIEDLPRILRRTGFNPDHFTDSDLEVVKLASQILYDQLVAESEIIHEIQQEDAAWLNRLILGSVTSFLLLLLIIDLVRRKSAG